MYLNKIFTILLQFYTYPVISNIILLTLIFSYDVYHMGDMFRQ